MVARVGVVRNFALGLDNTGKRVATFDCYVDDSLSFPITVTGASQILAFLNAAGLLTRLGQVNGLPLIVQRADDGSFTFDHIATF